TAGFRDLQAQLEGTENRITVERGRFNDAVREFNTAVKTFPNSMLASHYGFQAKPYFTAQPGAEKPPQVQFDFGAKKP
ncbi:MAG: LemA family protein, partial [Kiritimatiellaeota bacterium]|nr:LemA family protein [Kiritimatiellota bacterium]